MTTDTDNLTPQERLARIVREETDDGRRIVRFFVKVAEGELESEGFKPHHRIAAGRELLLRGFGPVSAWSELQPVVQPQSRAESQPEPLPEPMIDYINDALRAYEEPNPLEEMLSPELMEVVESDEPIECPCSIAESEGRDIPCPENEECPYYGIEFPKFTEEESERVKEWAVDGLRRRFEMIWGSPNPSEDDP